MAEGTRSVPLMQHSEGPNRAICATCSTGGTSVLVLCCVLPAEQRTLVCVECQANRGRLLPQLGYLKPGDVQLLNTPMFCVSKSFLFMVGHS